MAGRGGLVRGVKIDVKRLHETWMELVFPRQRDSDRSVLGKWKPTTSSGRAAYRVWGVVGALVVGVLYPLALVGFFLRFQAQQLDDAATRLGIVGVLVLSVLLWGGLTALAKVRFSFEGFLAMAAAALVATVAGVLAVLASRAGGRTTSVLVAYPLGVTAVFLPPVVAALYSPAVASVVFPQSESLAAWFLDNVFAIGGVNDYLRTRYDLTGLSYVGMWVGLSVPTGWFVGVLVTLANVVRPTR